MSGMSGLSIPVEFNGEVFAPLVMVDLPEGTRCFVQVPALKQPPPITDEHKSLWAEITRQVELSPPVFPTLDAAMMSLRGHV